MVWWYQRRNFVEYKVDARKETMFLINNNWSTNDKHRKKKKRFDNTREEFFLAEIWSLNDQYRKKKFGWY